MTTLTDAITRVSIWKDGAVPTHLMNEYEYWDGVVFDGGEEPTFIHWTHPNYFMLLWAGEQWVSACAIVKRTVTVGGTELNVGGLTTVMTKPHFRRNGYAATLVKAATEVINDNLNRTGLLICTPSLEQYYQRLGWSTADSGPALFTQPGQPKPRALEAYTVTMYHPRSGEEWPSGQVDLQGTPW